MKIIKCGYTITILAKHQINIDKNVIFCKNLNMAENNQQTAQRIVMLVLVLMLFTGTTLLHIRNKNKEDGFSVIKASRENLVNELKDLEKQLKEINMVNINTAQAEELVRIPGIGPKTARKVILYRQKRGIFMTPEDLLLIKGIGEKTLDKMRPYLKL
jgi:comEA protein